MRLILFTRIYLRWQGSPSHFRSFRGEFFRCASWSAHRSITIRPKRHTVEAPIGTGGFAACHDTDCPPFEHQVSNIYRHQCGTARDIAPQSTLLFLFMGGLNLQAVHHLLPGKSSGGKLACTVSILSDNIRSLVTPCLHSSCKHVRRREPLPPRRSPTGRRGSSSKARSGLCDLPIASRRAIACRFALSGENAGKRFFVVTKQTFRGYLPCFPSQALSAKPANPDSSGVFPTDGRGRKA